MNQSTFEYILEGAKRGNVGGLSMLIQEAKRVRALVQCCPHDDDFDGNCRYHSGKVPAKRCEDSPTGSHAKQYYEGGICFHCGRGKP